MKERRGQFFTKSADVQEAMASLLTHAPSSSRGLEPSAGAGDLVSTLERHGYADIDAIEFDPSIEAICETEIERGSFFRYAHGKEGRYDIIFGNPRTSHGRTSRIRRRPTEMSSKSRIAATPTSAISISCSSTGASTCCPTAGSSC